jgi:hypothetical protein
MALTLGFLALLALIIVRQVLANYENIQLNESLRDLTANLEVRVREKTFELMRQRSREAESGTSAEPRGKHAGERMEGFPDWPDELPARPRSGG